jgi:hypothetical protein
MKHFLILGFSLIFTLLIVSVLFIKFDTSAAANFTDNVIRPIIGANNTVELEKIFFNTQDRVQRIEYAHTTPKNPLLKYEATSSPNSQTNLNLNPILVDPSLKPLKDEGVWLNHPLSLFQNQEAMAYTFIRPDPARPFAFTTLVQLDMNLMRLGTVAGIGFPGGPIGNHGPGKIPTTIVQSNTLIAAFNGGFQYQDGQYGMIVGNKTYVPLKNDLGTLVGYTDGTLQIINYSGQPLGEKVAFIRQNCPILIENGSITVNQPQDKAMWGRTVTSGMYTWRSGLGLTANGNLIFAVGSNLTPATLALALKDAGAVNAIQLDINPNWVRFNIFTPLGNGLYSTTTLTKDLVDGSEEYLKGYQKDFFYVYKK